MLMNQLIVETFLEIIEIIFLSGFSFNLGNSFALDAELVVIMIVIEIVVVRGWIKKFLESTYIQVLDNGFPMMEFAPQRGLRQGDPFAPFMFTIVMEGLSGMMREVVKMTTGM